MSKPQRVHDIDGPDQRLDVGRGAGSTARREVDYLSTDEVAQRDREHAEAEAALNAVMQREQSRATAAAVIGKTTRKAPLKQLLLLSLIAFNIYAWAGNPEWLRFHQPELPAPSYYANSWKLAVYLQRQRIEEYRARKGKLPLTAGQAGPPVKGVAYRPLEAHHYELAAGDGLRRFVYLSSDSVGILVGQAFVQMSLLAAGSR